MSGYQNNGPSIGWFCSYTPEEILHAAGFNPIGIKRSSGCEDEDIYLGRSMCSFVHSIFGGALNNKYEYLDGVIIPHCCECMRRLYDGWVEWNDQVSPSFAYQLDVPDFSTDLSIKYFSKNIIRFKEAIEKQYNCEISENSIIESINIYNKTRELLKKMYDLRKRPEPPISGTQVLEILEICMTTQKEIFNEYFEIFIESIAKNPIGYFKDFRYRILIYGGIYNPALVKYIERDGTGGVVVCEDACLGARYFDKQVDLKEGADPYEAISTRYLSKMPCPRMSGRRHGEEMPDNLLELIKEYRADAVVYYITKRCDNLYWEYPVIQELLEKNNIPLKRIEGDISGDIQQREIRSFIEFLDFNQD